MYLVLRLRAFGGIFLEADMWNSTHICIRHSNISRNRSLNKGHLYEGKYVFGP
jgi:hypothetical protein